MKSVLVINDTTRDFGHIGCKEVMQNIHTLCRKNNLHIQYSFMAPNLHQKDWFLNALTHVDGVLINGEGSLHHDNLTTYNILKNAAIAKDMGKKVILVNALWYKNNILFNALSVFDKIFVRDKLSYDEVKQRGFDATLIPDLSLYISQQREQLSIEIELLFTDSVIYENCMWLIKEAESKKAAFRFMNLCAIPLFKKGLYEKMRDSYIDYNDALQRNCKMKVSKRIAYQLGNFCISYSNRRKWLLTSEDIQKASFVVTGRFHCALLCIKYRVPFIAIPSNTPKIEIFMDEMQLDQSQVLLQLREDLTEERIEACKAYWNNIGFDIANRFVHQSQARIEDSFATINALFDV